MVRMLVVSVVGFSMLVGLPSSPSRSDGAVGAPEPGPQRQAQASEVHSPPVDAPIVDYFRPPEESWLAGNRGLEYDTEIGQTVRASAGGVVTFAGQVGGRLFVTVQHGPELRTTVGFVQHILVSAGDLVVLGQPIATAGESIHFTARRNGSYIDPLLLFGRIRVVVRLVPTPH